MKAMLRALGLVAVLACAVLSTASADVVGTCKTDCLSISPFSYTHVTWSATQSDCCSGAVNPCPPGATAHPFSWAAPHGAQQVCRPPA